MELDNVIETETPELPVETPEIEQAVEAPSEPRIMSVNEAVKDAVAQSKQTSRQRDTSGKFVAGAEQATDKQPDKVSEVSTQAKTSAQKAPAGMPPSLNDEERTQWPTYSPQAQKAIQRIEEAGRKGFEQYKLQYQGYDQVNAKVSPVLKQLNIQPRDFYEGAAGWFLALANPQVNAQQRYIAAAGFLKNLGLDPATVAGLAQQAPQQQNGQYQSNGQVPYQYNALQQDVEQLKAHLTAQAYQSAESQVKNWAKDKPYYEQVKGLMAQAIQEGKVPVNNGVPDLDAAYKLVVEPIESQVAQKYQQEQTQRAQQAAQKAQQARKVGSSLTTSAPGVAVRQNGTKPKTETPRESILRAMKELSA